MNFSRLHKVVAYLLSGLGFFALSLGHELSQPVILLIAALFTLSYFAEGPILARPGYSRAWTGLIVALLGVQLMRGLVDDATLSLALEFAAALQLSRLFNRRSAADYQQIAVLSFLHLIAATVLSTEIAYALTFAGFVIATPWMLALSHLRREIESNYPPAVATGAGDEKAGLSRVLASKRVVGPRYLMGTALLSLPLFLMTLLIFLLVPRVGQGFLGFGRSHGEKVAGFGNQVELGGFGVIRDDPSVVLRVTPIPVLDRRGPRLQLRLRGTAFDHYDGRLWTRSSDQKTPLSSSYNGTYIFRRPPKATDQRLRIVLDQLDQPVVFLPHAVVSLRIDPKVVRAQMVGRQLSLAPGYDLRYLSDDGVGLIYEAFVSRDPLEAGVPAMKDEDLETYLQVPEHHQRVAELARSVSATAQSPLDKAKAIRDYLQSRRFTYSLQQPPVGPAEQPLDVFLFDEHRGHCEYFATAMAIMLRTLGVPARNVTGFVGGRYNSFGEYYAIRQGDAHSWVEVFVEDRGWVTFDPTPIAAGELSMRDGLWSDLHAVADALKMRWMTSVVGYDLRTQVGILRDIGRLFSGLGSPAGSSNPREGGQVKGTAKMVVVALFLILVLAGLAYALRRRLQRSHRGAGQSAAETQAIALYQQLETALKRQGLSRPSERTPVEHAAMLRESAAPQASVVSRVTDAYMGARYGGVAVPEAEIKQLRQAIDRLGDRPQPPRAARLG